MLEMGFTGFSGLGEPEDPWAGVSAQSCSVWIQTTTRVQAVDFLRGVQCLWEHEYDGHKHSGQVMGKAKPERKMGNMRQNWCPTWFSLILVLLFIVQTHPPPPLSSSVLSNDSICPPQEGDHG